MDRVRFELAPLGTRIRAVAVLGVAVALQLFSMFSATWFTARVGGETHSVGILKVFDAPELSADPDGLLHALVLIMLLLLAIAYLYKLVYVGITVMLNRPLVRRGLFRSKLLVSWRTPVRAQVQTAILTVFAAVAAYLMPHLSVAGTDVAVPAEMHYSWGGALLVLAFVLAHVGLYLIARDPVLAATQTWGEPATDDRPQAAPIRTERPMIKSPLPPPPTGLATDPFRAPPPAASIEDRLVRPALPTSVPSVVATGQAEEPSLLR